MQSHVPQTFYTKVGRQKGKEVDTVADLMRRFNLSAQVLYVPRHWWHYVESVDPITVSVNSWVDMVRILEM